MSRRRYRMVGTLPPEVQDRAERMLRRAPRPVAEAGYTHPPDMVWRDPSGAYVCAACSDREALGPWVG